MAMYRRQDVENHPKLKKSSRTNNVYVHIFLNLNFWVFVEICAQFSKNGESVRGGVAVEGSGGQGGGGGQGQGR